MLIDPYNIAKVGLVAAGTTLGVQVATDKPPPQLIVNEYGQEDYFQDVSRIEAGITRATKVTEEIDAKIVAKFLHALQKKALEVAREHESLVEADPELRAMVQGKQGVLQGIQRKLKSADGDENWDRSFKELERSLRQ